MKAGAAVARPGSMAGRPVSVAIHRCLQSPAAYAGLCGAPAEVETVETHMSWVFLVGAHVLKLKKAVRHDFLDFSTLSAREACCREELRLNARLAPGVYLGLVALRWHAGRFELTPEEALPGRDDVVDWLVWMRRLPAANMLDRAVANRSVEDGDIDALADVLVDFYRRAARVNLAPQAYLARMQRQQDITRALLLRPGLPVDGAAHTLERLDAALRQEGPALARRAASGRIVEGHGDLRPEHVCLLRPPVVIDCIEFNAALREVDPFDELAFLALECDMAGAGWAGPRLIARCSAALGDAPPPGVLQIYTASRALLRARLSLAHLLDARPRTPGRWLPQARAYVAHACHALEAYECGASGLSATRPRGYP